MSLGTLEAPNQPNSGNSCSKCGNAQDASDSVCRHCGYYAKLNIFVEVDETDKHYSNGDYNIPDENENSSEHEYVRALKEVPTWVWKLGGVVAFVSVLCFAFHFVAPVGSALRLVGVMAIVNFGLITAFVAHALMGVLVVREERELGGWDIVISPFRIWRHILVRLPRLFNGTAICIGCLWAVLLAHMIIGVPYYELMTAGDPPAKKKKEPSMIAGMPGAGEMTQEEMEDALKKLEEDAEAAIEEATEKAALTLEQAIQQVWQEAFEETGPGVVSDADADKLNQTRRVKLRALTIGVKQDEEGEVMALIVAIKSQGEWRVAGAVSSGLTPEASAKIQTQIDSIRRDEPFVPSKIRATWIEPIIYCNIEADYTPNEDKFEKFSLLGVD